MSLQTIEEPKKDFVKERKRHRVKRFVDRNKMNLSLSISTLLQVAVILFWYVPDLKLENKLDRLVDEVAFIDNVQIQESASDSVAEDGDIELTDKKKVEIKEDPRIAGAQDTILSGATSPIDLSPSAKPDYTEEARSNGVTGTITLEIIIADTGDVLQARSVGKTLGFGLEQQAIQVYKKKKFSPSILDGKAITVKVLIPIRFSLN